MFFHSGGRVVNSALSLDVRVNSYCEIDHSILLAHVNSGRYSRIRNAIIDRGVVLPENTMIGFEAEEDRKRYVVTLNGVVVVVENESPLED
jgi:glucose-1-phosphate adenylyltransferase